MNTKIKHLEASDVIDAVFAVTYVCNSRCIQCNIWQYKGPEPLKAEEYLKVPSNLRIANISGGECFLRPDIALVMANIKKAAPKVRFKISTNGFATDITRKRMIEILEVIPKKDIGVVISIDGDEKKQFEIRQIPDGFRKNMETIKMFRELGINDITIAFTAGDYNIDQLMEMYNLSGKLGAEFTVAILHNSEHYFQTSGNKIERTAVFIKEFLKLAREELKTWSPKRWVRAFFAYGIVFNLAKKKRLLPNYAGCKDFFMDANGFVYPSTDGSSRLMGNIKDYDSFQSLLNSEEAIKAVNKEVNNRYWMICTVRTAIQTHPIKVISWILKSKFMPSTLKAPEIE